MIYRWLHVNEIGSDPWVLPIWNAINSAVKKGICQDIDNECREIGIHVSTRLNMLPVIVDRINTEWKTLYSSINYKDENIYEDWVNAISLNVDKRNLNKLLVDIDSFLFETNSCCELMQKLMGKIYAHKGIAFNESDMGKIMAKMLIDNGQNPNWFRLLDDERNIFIHNAAPYIAIDITKEEDPNLIIMKGNLKIFKDDSKYITLRDMDYIVTGFNNAKIILQEYLIKLYAN